MNLLENRSSKRRALAAWIALGVVVALVGHVVWLRPGKQQPSGERVPETDDDASRSESGVQGVRKAPGGGIHTDTQSGAHDDREPTQGGAEDGLVSHVPPPPELDPAASPDVLAVVGRDDAVLGYRERDDALRRLGRDLRATDVATLRAFIREPGEATHMRPIELNALRNDALDILVQQNEVHPDIAWDLAHVFRDPQQDDTWRNYVLQFFLAYWEARTGTVEGIRELSDFSRLTDAADLAALQLTREVLTEALDERSGSIAGTALLHMLEMSGERGAFREEQVADAALDVLRDGGASQASRLTALRVAADLDVAEALEPARMIAQTGESTLFRMVAIAALGDIGTPEDRDLLVAFAAEDNPRVQETAGKALEKLDER